MVAFHTGVSQSRFPMSLRRSKFTVLDIQHMRIFKNFALEQETAVECLDTSSSSENSLCAAIGSATNTTRSFENDSSTAKRDGMEIERPGVEV